MKKKKTIEKGKESSFAKFCIKYRWWLLIGGILTMPYIFGFPILILGIYGFVKMPQKKKEIQIKISRSDTKRQEKWTIIGSAKKITDKVFDYIDNNLIEGEKVDYVVAAFLGSFLVVTNHRIIIFNRLLPLVPYLSGKSYYYQDIESLETDSIQASFEITTKGGRTFTSGFSGEYKFIYGASLKNEMNPIIKKIRTRIRSAKK